MIEALPFSAVTRALDLSLENARRERGAYALGHELGNLQGTLLRLAIAHPELRPEIIATLKV